MVLHAALIATLAVAPAQQQAAPGAIRGVVRGQADAGAQALPHALVQVAAAGAPLVAMADGAGAYALAAVPPGLQRLRVVHLGYRPLEVEVLVPAGDTVTLDFELEPEPVALAPLTVWGDPGRAASRDTMPRPVADLAEAAVRALDVSPGMAEAGLGAAARTAAGGEPPDPAAVLLMRGSTADLKLVLLDGAPVYTPFHLGGLLPSFDVEALEGADLYLGGAPARYDGGLSYILDLRTRRAHRDRVRGTGAIDLLGARLALEAPAGERAGLTVASRALHSMADGLLWDGRAPYGYLDAHARLDVDLAPAHRVSATGFWNREAVYLDLAAAGASASRLTGSADDATWGNAAAAFAYEGSLGATGAGVTAAFTRYRARLPLAGAIPRLARGTSARTRLTADFRRGIGEGVLRYGASYDGLATEYGARILDAHASHPVEVGAHAAAAGAYVEGEGPVGSDLRVRGGLRVDHFSGEGGLRAAPRLSVTWLLTDDAAVTLAVGRYHQYARAPDTLVHLALGDSATALQPGEPLLPVAAASHVVLSLDQQLAPRLRLGLDGFVKRFTGTAGSDLEPLHASGVDLRVLREGARTTTWLGYSLTWYWEGAGARATRSRFTGRHLLSAGVAGRISERAGVDVRVAYGDGLPYTAIPVARDAMAEASPLGLSSRREVVDAAAPLAGGLTDDFFRIDAEVFGVLSPRWHGRRVEVRPYLKVLNALDRRDALFYYFEPWRDPRVRPIAELSLLPVIGLEWRF